MSSKSNYWLNPSTLLLGIWTINSIQKDSKWFTGDRLIVWRRGYDVLATGPNVVSADPRVSVEKHSGINILNIRDIGEQDAGEYVCQVREMVASYHTEGISTLFPVSDLNTKWYSICAAHSERARYVQWIMRLWHDVTGRKRNTQPENGKGLNVQRKWISRNEKCLFSLFPEMECSTPWLNSLSSWVFTDAAVARQLISPLSLNSLIPWIKWDKLQFVLSELGNLSLLRTFDKTFNAKPWKMMESILYFFISLLTR